MSKQQQYVAVVSLGGRILHAVGPFPTEAEAAREGRAVGQAVEMFRPACHEDDSVGVQVLQMFANLGALIPG